MDSYSFYDGIVKNGSELDTYSDYDGFITNNSEFNVSRSILCKGPELSQFLTILTVNIVLNDLGHTLRIPNTKLHYVSDFTGIGS